MKFISFDAITVLFDSTINFFYLNMNFDYKKKKYFISIVSLPNPFSYYKFKNEKSIGYIWMRQHSTQFSHHNNGRVVWTPI